MHGLRDRESACCQIPWLIIWLLLCRCYGTAKVAGRHCLLLEYVQYTLREYFWGVHVTDATLKMLGQQLAQALSYLHKRHIVHRSASRTACHGSSWMAHGRQHSGYLLLLY